MTEAETHFPFADRHVVVVGGSSAIGFATARRARLAGAQVTLIIRKQDRLRDVAGTMCGARILTADLDDMAAIPSLLQDTPPIDHLVITASTPGLQREKSGVGELARFITEGLAVPLLLVKSSSKNLRQTGSVTLASRQPPPRSLGMTSSLTQVLAAIEVAGRALATDLWPLRVNVVAPGVVDTSLFDTVLGEESHMPGRANPALSARPIVTAEDVAHAYLFLMSASSVTGEVLYVDGAGHWTGNSGSLSGLTFRAPATAC
jgi:NAD(P)-dependent dehydrogenase (short-subunit alcohol dehydrogenase family)